MCTGSQGEPRAALARIATDDHPLVTLNKGDKVIFSSRTIPGNEKAVGNIINGLVTQGIEVITDRTHLVHVSGHPRRDELRDMISWVKPQILIPAHGEALHLAEHADLARKAGVPKVIVCKNGDLVKLGPGDPGVIDQLPHGRLYKDGSLLETEKARAVAERRRCRLLASCSLRWRSPRRANLPTTRRSICRRSGEGRRRQADRRSRLRYRAIHLREPAAREAARPGRGGGKHPPRGAQRGQRRLGQEAGLPGAGADGLNASAVVLSPQALNDVTHAASIDSASVNFVATHPKSVSPYFDAASSEGLVIVWR